MRPDPTFHASPKLAMEAPPENFAYTLLLSPDFSKPDALAVIDTKPGSPTFSQIVHPVTMPTLEPAEQAAVDDESSQDNEK
jgi:selenium-binding protein 1